MRTSTLCIQAVQILLRGGLTTHLGLAAIVVVETLSREVDVIAPILVTILVIFTEGRRRTQDREARGRAMRWALGSGALSAIVHRICTSIPDPSVAQEDTELVTIAIGMTFVILIGTWIAYIRAGQWVVCQLLSAWYATAGKGLGIDEAFIRAFEIAQHAPRARAAGQCLAISLAVLLIAGAIVATFVGTGAYASIANILGCATGAFMGAVAVALWGEPMPEERERTPARAHTSGASA